jgi:hypothetical protein
MLSVVSASVTLAVNFAPAVNYAVGTTPEAIAIADFNGDGRPDLAVANFGSNNVSILIGNGDGTFRATTAYHTGSRPLSVIAADFNHDGKMDLALANNTSSGTVTILLGTGTGSFQSAVLYNTGSYSRWATAGDFNGDGNLDLAVVNQNSNNLSILLGNGDGTFQAAVNYACGSAPVFAIAADLNGDGFLDVAVADASGGSSSVVSVLLGNGNGTFQAATSYGVGSRPESLAVKDFNGDGILDIASANFDASNMSILIGKGNGSFQPAVNYPVGAAPISIVAADFNGDGKTDLATADFRAAKAGVLLGNGDGTFQPVAYFSAASSPRGIASADFNGDNAPDLAVVNETSQNVSVLLNSGGTVCTTTSFPNPSTQGQSVTLTTTCTPGLAGGATPTGTITWIENGNTTVGTASLSAGTAMISTTTLAAGKDSIVADYSGDATYNPNAAPALIQTVNGGGSAAATLTPSSLTFATQLVKTVSPPQNITLTSTGTSALSITSIAVTSTNFAETNNCPSSLAPGASCTISVTFQPMAKGVLTGTLQVTDNASNSPQTASLTGTCTFVQLVPASLNFGTVTVGTTSAPQTVTLTNEGTSGKLNITGIKFTGTNPADFAQTNTCGSSVPARGTCTITVTFTPTATGTRTASLGVYDDGGGSPQTVAVSGTGM